MKHVIPAWLSMIVASTLMPLESAAQPELKQEIAGVTQSNDSAAQTVERVRSSIVEISIEGRDGENQGLGTGFIVSADGLIATNLHVIGEARPIIVRTADNRSLKLTHIHASDVAHDLAILRVDANQLSPLVLANAQDLTVGDPVIAVGHPQGLKHSVVSGLVSGRREIDGRDMIQLAIPIEPGNSGGPLLDREGRVHGILTMKSAVTANLGFAVPVDALRALLDAPNPIPVSRWLTIGALDPSEWKAVFGARWQQRAGRILVSGSGKGFGGRSLCISEIDVPSRPYEVAAVIKLDDESGAAGLIFDFDGADKHYGFYPSNGRLRLTHFNGPTVYQWNVLQEVETEHYRPGDWNRLKVRLEDGRLLCYVNDHLVIESTNQQLGEGSVGLAKFRETEAEFKGFDLADSLPENAASAETILELNRHIDALPAAHDRMPSDLAPLATRGGDTAIILARRIQDAEQQLSNLQQLRRDIHRQTIVDELRQIVAEDQDDFNLAHAALLVAKLDNDDVDVDAYLKELDSMADDIQDELPEDAEETSRLAALNRYLFEDRGFHGSRTDYYHRANSYLNQVIDDREGLPITLSVLYMELGKRLGLNIEGIGLPGHFLVRFVPANGEPQLIDSFHRGEPLERDEAARRAAAIVGTEIDDQYFRAANPASIIVRLLRNLLGVAQRDEQPEAMLGYVESMLAVQPDLVSERGLRALLRHQTGHREAALSDLDWFLEHEPPGINLEEIRQLRRRFASTP